MSNMWLKIKVWTKIVVFGLVLVYIIVFVAKNSARPITPWLGPNLEPPTSAFMLALYAFLAGVLVAVLVRTTYRTIAQIRELRQRQRTERMERDVSDIKTKAGMLRAKSDVAAD